MPPSDPRRFRPTVERPVRAKARLLGADAEIQPHRHVWAQVVICVSGVARVSAERATFLVPGSRAVWIPPGIEHAVVALEAAELRSLYLHQDEGAPGPGVPPAEQAAWHGCRVLEVSPLLRELAQQLDEEPRGAPDARERCVAALLQDELHRARPVPLGVGLPNDKRLRALCEAVLDDPARHATLEGWAAEAGASVRTVARLFRQELGTTFAEWRQQVLLAKALSMAARKRPMSHIASALGYASASAFTAMVRRSVGMPPSRFFAAAG